VLRSATRRPREGSRTRPASNGFRPLDRGYPPTSLLNISHDFSSPEICPATATFFAWFLALDSDGTRMPISSPMIAITVSSSINVNAERTDLLVLMLVHLVAMAPEPAAPTLPRFLGRANPA
jgi:hypothetical protein